MKNGFQGIVKNSSLDFLRIKGIYPHPLFSTFQRRQGSKMISDMKKATSQKSVRLLFQSEMQICEKFISSTLIFNIT